MNAGEHAVAALVVVVVVAAVVAVCSCCYSAVCLPSTTIMLAFDITRLSLPLQGLLFLRLCELAGDNSCYAYPEAYKPKP